MTSQTDRIKGAAHIGLLIIILALGCGSTIEAIKPMPDSAQLLVDPAAREFVSPPCLQQLSYPDASRFSVRITKRELPKEYKGEKRCSDGIPGWFTKESGFWHEQSLTTSLLRRWGVLPAKNRWNHDGTWNW